MPLFDRTLEKIRYVLSHDRERRVIAAEGQKRTLRDQAVQQRAQPLHDLIVDWINNH